MLLEVCSPVMSPGHGGSLTEQLFCLDKRGQSFLLVGGKAVTNSDFMTASSQKLVLPAGVSIWRRRCFTVLVTVSCL